MNDCPSLTINLAYYYNGKTEAYDVIMKQSWLC